MIDLPNLLRDGRHKSAVARLSSKRSWRPVGWRVRRRKPQQGVFKNARSRREGRLRSTVATSLRYLMAVEMLLKVVFRLVPRVLTTRMIAAAPTSIFRDISGRLCDARVAAQSADLVRAGSFLMRVRSQTGADDGALAHFSMPPSALGKRIRTMHVPANDAAHPPAGPSPPSSSAAKVGMRGRGVNGRSPSCDDVDLNHPARDAQRRSRLGHSAKPIPARPSCFRAPF